MGVVEILLLVLIAVVIVFGFGVVLLNRRREDGSAPPAMRTPPVTPPPRPGADELGEGSILTEDRPADTTVVESPTEVPVVAPEPEAPPATLRDRLAKARSTFAGAIAGVLGLSGGDDEPFDDL